MGVIQNSIKQGMDIQENLKQQVNYLVFGLMSVLVFSQGGWKGFGLFYVVMLILDYILMKKNGDL